ncbi:hypothetical protein HPB50_004274 [Hyalomma asiaticum]|uniref:Uncharacterized protein n=1 Tax=Hyalomma asiaticum TaxID=266040 RepID=A0ACB7TC32_HYAAI|nr:hypothetical protein HPB50_004274 [Hyalomma asiaticum]
MPDLTFTKNVRATWDNLSEDLGSDHYILEIIINNEAKAPRKFNITDWDHLRKLREERGSTDSSYEGLLNELQKAANEATKEVERDASIQAMDSHLASLLQKKHDLKEAWNKNKLNRHLRAEIAELGREIESHAKKLCAQQWNNACDEADGKMRRGSKWGLLKHLMADSDKPTKGGAQLQIERLVPKHAKEHDSKTAARTFAAGLLARSTAKLTDNAIRKYESKETLIEEEKAQIHISWFPAHMGQISGVDHCNPNEEVNRLARELTRPAADNDAYEGERVDPDTPPTCSLCDHPYCNFEHMLWLCPTHSTTQLSTQEAWQAVITSNDYNIQLQAVQRARDIATSLRLPAPSWAEPPG